MRQAVLIALGLALGVGLVITVAAASAGVAKAQTDILSALYGVGTDVTVTGAAPGPPSPGSSTSPPKNAQTLQQGPNGIEMCTNGNCVSVAGQTIDNVNPPYMPFSASKVADVAKLHDVSAAVGGLTLLDQSVTFPKGSSSTPPQPNSVSLDGVDVAHTSLGPFSGASLTSGHSFTAAEAHSDVAVVDSGYAKSNNLKVGSTFKLAQVTYTVVGIVDQPQSSSNPPEVYIPLAAAQAISTQVMGAMTGDVNTVYVTAAGSADVSAVGKEISALLPGTTVTTASSLASTVTGSVTSAAALVNDLGRWLSVLVLIAAFALASLLTMAAVARRVREFGTLKAIGWRSRRIVAQVLGESVAIGVVGAALGIGVGYAGAAIIAAVAPPLSASVGGNLGQPQSSGQAGGTTELIGGSVLTHMVNVPLSPSVGVGALVLAVALALLGGLVAGAFGSWRIAGLRPADALARVA